MNDEPSVLIFPSGLSHSVAFEKALRSMNLRVVQASSESHGVTSSEIRYLPYITADDFQDAFVALLSAEGIKWVHAPHPGVWWKLREFCQDGTFPVSFCLVNEAPHLADCAIQAHAFAWARSCKEAQPLAPTAAPPLAANRYANLYWNYRSIPGESDDAKIWLLTQIFRLAVPGDVVEIGAAYGRSAYALAWLADFHAVGSLICIDPWDLSSSRNQGADAQIINNAVIDVNWDAVHRSFIAALSGFSHVNYIRQPAATALNSYLRAAVVGALESIDFGPVKITGEIAVLHIDGNHRYEDVAQDMASWVPLVKPGGWILIDDYLWAFGDGPRRAGNELLSHVQAEQAFVVGDTLCIRLSQAGMTE